MRLIACLNAFNGLLVLATVSLSPTDGDGLYSRLATPIWSIASRGTGLASPDGLGSIHAIKASSGDDAWPFKAWVVRNGRRYNLRFGSFVNSEVEWSPDSLAFFVTYSDGGAVGQYHVLVYRFEEAGLRSFEPVPNGSRLFKTFCFTPEDPNVGAIRWGPDSKTLLIAVEVPPHSSCASMGTFRAVEITIPEGKPLKSYNQLEAKRLFGSSLGVELVGADDECIERPNSCVPPGLTLPPSRQ